MQVVGKSSTNCWVGGYLGLELYVKKMISTLVVAEHISGQLSPSCANVISAAKQLNGNINVLVSGCQVNEIVQSSAKLNGVNKVLVADDEYLKHQLAETNATLLVHLQNRQKYDYILGASSTFGKDLFPRAAALLNVQPLSDIIRIIDGTTFVRPIYAGNAIATVKCGQQGVKMFTIRASAFEPSLSGNSTAEIENVQNDILQEAKNTPTRNDWVSDRQSGGDRPDLSAAKVVISGGRALQSTKNFDMLYELADVLGGAVGATRAAVDAGYISNELQIGQTGKVIAPQLYIGVGISGAIQHIAGIKDAGTIVAINKDENAPLFSVADYGLKQDLFEAVPELVAKLRKLKSEKA